MTVEWKDGSNRSFFGGGKGGLIPIRFGETQARDAFEDQFAIEALEQWRGDPLADWEEWLYRARSRTQDITTALDAYCLGDRLGAPWESNAAHWKPVPYEQIVQRANAYPLGTDEADTVRCFQRFVAEYRFDGNREQLLVAWARYHQLHRRATSYGGTWKDYFQTVKALDRNNRLTVEALFSLAAERKPGGSAGNGCLALALPVYAYARQIELPPTDLIRAFFRLSHAHEKALGCGEFLCTLFDALFENGAAPELNPACASIRRFFAEREWTLDPETFARRAPHNLICCQTVTHALYAVARATTPLRMVHDVVNMGGDVDSVLALALMLFSITAHDCNGVQFWEKLLSNTKRE